MIAKQKEQVAAVKNPAQGSGIGRRSIQIRFSERRVLLILIDSMIVIMAAWGIAWFWQRWGLARTEVRLLYSNWFWIASVLAGWWVLALLNDLYDVSTSDNVRLSMLRLVIIVFSALTIIVVVAFLDPRAPSLLFFLQFLLLLLVTIAIWRYVYAVSTYRPPFLHRVLVIGGGRRGRAIADLLKQGPGAKCLVMGFVDDDLVAQQAMAEDVPLLGGESDLPQLAWRLGIHEVVVAKDRNLEAQLFELLVDCQAQGIRVSWMPELYGKLSRQTPIEYIDPAWVLQAMEGRPVFSRLQQFSKRLLDLAVVIMALPVLLLIMLPVAVAIRLDSPGPAFYRQTRAGRGNSPFSIFKFRTMFTDAEKDGRARWAEKNDPRITRVGRILRKARLDELPQALNVLRGEMSLVGPRPERPEFIEELQRAIPFYRTRLMVKPGITGWAQVQYDYGSSTEDALNKLQYDFYYIQYWSLWMDLYILYRTIGVIARLKGR